MNFDILKEGQEVLVESPSTLTIDSEIVARVKTVISPTHYMLESDVLELITGDECTYTFHLFTEEMKYKKYD